MEYHRVEFTIKPDGSVSEKVLTSGPKCTDLTKEMESAMGKVESQELVSDSLATEIESESDSLVNQVWQ